MRSVTRRLVAPLTVVALGAGAAVVAGTAAGPVATAAVPTVTLTSTQTPPPLRLTSARLAARPPVLSNPITLYPRAGIGDIKLSTTRDYIIRLPRGVAWVNAKGLSIAGGRNVVVIGGLVDVRSGYLDSGGEVTRRAAYLRGSTGTVHIEGVRFLSSTRGSLTEGIDVSLPGATLHLQNIFLHSRLVGSNATNHADALQAWAGPRRLVVDGFTAVTYYQGFFLTPNQHSTAAVTGYDLRRVHLVGLSSSMLLWRDNATWPIRTTQVYAHGSHIYNGGFWPSKAWWPYVYVKTAPTTFGSAAGSRYLSPGYL